MRSRRAPTVPGRTRARGVAQACATVALVGGGGAILGACSTSTPAQIGSATSSHVAKSSVAKSSAAKSSAAKRSGATASGGSVLSGEMQAGYGAVVPIVLQRDDTSGVTGTVTGKPEWPRYSPSVVVVPAAKQVTLVIDSFDDGTTPLPSSLANYDNVQGGVETVNGKTVSSVPNTEIAHTFTVPELGISVPVYGRPGDAPDGAADGDAVLSGWGRTPPTRARTARPPTPGDRGTPPPAPRPATGTRASTTRTPPPGPRRSPRLPADGPAPASRSA